MIERLGQFTAEYSNALCRLLGDGQCTPLPFHGEVAPFAMMATASDGVITTYYPSWDWCDRPPGVQEFDFSEFDINTVCQSLSGRYLRVYLPELGKCLGPLERCDDIPQEQLVPGSSGYFLNKEIIEELYHRCSEGLPIVSFPAMQVSPFVHYERGIAKEIVPCRFKLWSPVVDVPRLGIRRLFKWTHADIWWNAEKLDLDTSRAADVARNDLQALQVLLAESAVLDPGKAEHDTPSEAADVLERQCEELMTLLGFSGDKEEVIHQWLRDPAHRMFLDSDAANVWSKVRFGNRESDFVIRRTDGTYRLVEIERANLRLFTKSKSEPTAEFNHACQQVCDWQRYIRDNAHTVRTELGLHGIYEPKGVVIMGRSADIDSDEARTRWRDMKNNHKHDLFTYDEECERVRALASTLRGLMTEL